MTDREAHESSRDREDAETTVRALSSLDEKLMHIDLSAAVEQLRQEERWTTTGRNAMTVVKYRNLRIVLEVMRPGARIDDPRPETGGAVVVQVLTGRLRLRADGQQIDLAAGRMVALDHMTPSELTPLDESAFLIWVSWDDERGAAGRPADDRAGHVAGVGAAALGTSTPGAKTRGSAAR